ncbi:hypothetical protein RIEGSTA812A_PEG_920 [invertebrate metagenome]|uniref:Uncharacterized protein n=1 Tax=invertebrate metagenome TaxID=1711999 RepID=A0A484H5V4_9ZZZZ
MSCEFFRLASVLTTINRNNTRTAAFRNSFRVQTSFCAT